MTYLHALLSSRLPFASWIAIALWPALFLANRLVAQALLMANDRQTSYALENRHTFKRGSDPLWTLAQVLFAGVVFTVSLYAGGALFVFLGAGLDVSVICILGLNVQALLSTLAMARPGASEGSVKLSTGYAYRQMASRLYGAALMCALMGLLVAHLALLGGALLAAAAATGYLRRAPA
jgi:hypothetical protein